MKLLISLFIFMCLQVSAKTEFVLKMTNDSDNEINKVFINIDDHSGEVLGLDSITWDEDGNIVKELHFNTGEVLAGVVMVQMEGRDIVILQATNTDFRTKADLKLDFLKNGITGTRNDFEFKLLLKDGTWGVYKNTRKFIWAEVKTNSKPVIGAIGIKSVEIIE